MMTGSVMQAYLAPDEIIDSDHPSVMAYARNLIGHNPPDDVQTAVTLYYAVRDDILYDPYVLSKNPEDYRASETLARGRGFCVQKAALLCALGRACHIASRLGFATVKNHLASKQLIQYVGGNLFVFHGYTEFFLNGVWVKATPAFNASLCERHRVAPLEFDGRADSIFQPYNAEKQLFMEYIEYYGEFSTVPMTFMIETWTRFYGPEQVEKWFDPANIPRGGKRRDFYTEAPIIP